MNIEFLPFPKEKICPALSDKYDELEKIEAEIWRKRKKGESYEDLDVKAKEIKQTISDLHAAIGEVMKREDGLYRWRSRYSVQVKDGCVVGGRYTEGFRSLALRVFNAKTGELAPDGVEVDKFISGEYKLD